MNKFDLASIGYTDPWCAVKIEGLDAMADRPGLMSSTCRPRQRDALRDLRFPIGNGTDVPTILTEGIWQRRQRVAQ